MMNKTIDKIKDILYDSFDYVVILIIIVIVAAIIGWRLDILFANDVEDLDNDSEVVVVGPKDVTPNNDLPLEEEDENTIEETPIEETPDEIEIEEAVLPGEIVHIVIPSGSLPGKIALILSENKLIDNSRDFIAKVVELELDTKLKSGTYSIPMGSSYEEILEIITN